LTFYRDSVLVGLIETVNEGEQLLIENVAVSPDFQRQGLGKRLLAHAETVARASGCARVRLYTNKRFATNVALYLRLGYRIDGEEAVAPDTLRVDMSKVV
jgi:ribosomal protein S18 acetylase RimI-like enzyme